MGREMCRLSFIVQLLQSRLLGPANHHQTHCGVAHTHTYKHTTLPVTLHQTIETNTKAIQNNTNHPRKYPKNIQNHVPADPLWGGPVAPTHTHTYILPVTYYQTIQNHPKTIQTIQKPFTPSKNHSHHSKTTIKPSKIIQKPLKTKQNH